MNERLRERLVLALKGLGLGAVFVVAAGVGVALHVDLPAGRRVVARNVESLLNDTFQGRFEIIGIERLSSSTLRVREVRVRDPGGALVLSAKGLRVRADAFDVLAELLSSDPKTTVVFSHVRAEQASVVIVPDPKTGVPTLGSAFALAPRRKAKPSSTPSTLRVWFPTVELGEGFARGYLEGTPSAEGHVKGVRGSVLVSPVGVAVDAAQFSTVLRVAGSPEVRGIASFHERGTTHFYGTFDGYVGELQVNSVGRLDGNRLDLKLDVPNAEPFLVRPLYPDWPVNDKLTAHAELHGEIPSFQATAHVVAGDTIADASGDVHLGSEPYTRLAVTGEKVDLRAFIRDSPPTGIDTQGEIFVHGGPSGVVVDFSGSTKPTSISHHSRARGRFHGSLRKAPARSPRHAA
jgi:translocation and assembly module TamB